MSEEKKDGIFVKVLSEDFKVIGEQFAAFGEKTLLDDGRTVEPQRPLETVRQI